MKNRIVLAALMMMMIGGCNGPTKKQTLAAAIGAYTATAKVLTELIQEGEFTYQEALEIGKYDLMAAEALDAWYESVMSDSPPEAAIDRFIRAIDKLIEFEKSKKGGE